MQRIVTRLGGVPGRRLLATLLVTAAVLAIEVPVHATGNGSCTSGNGCVASGTASWNGTTNVYTGEMRGFSSNANNLGGSSYASGNTIANNVRSVRNRNSTYISFCVYDRVNQQSPLGGAQNWYWDGYGNVPQGSESTWFRVQSTC